MLSWIELDGSAFLKNVESFRSILPADTRVMVVVKANAYGHGLPEIAPLAAMAADWLGVNTIAEAHLIAATGAGKPIAILGYSEIGSAEAIVNSDFRQVVYRHDVAEALSQAAHKLARTAHIHLKIETGTNRQGVPLDELEDFVKSIRDLPGLEI